jgi:aspartate kinase
MKKTLVMKFGGAAVATPQHFATIAEIILKRKRDYSQIAIVVSAMGDTTNQLIQLAKQVHADPPQREYDMLVSVGERISISLLAMALASKQQEAVSFTGSQSGIVTCPRHTEARIIDVRPHRLWPVLEAGKVVIVAGFQGVSQHGEITTLGRGGSDTSAVALGIALCAERVEFYKDVAGIYAEDPKKNPVAPLLPALSYEEALAIALKGAKVLNARCIQLAANNGLPLYVRSFDKESVTGTLIAAQQGQRPTSPCYEQA